MGFFDGGGGDIVGGLVSGGLSMIGAQQQNTAMSNAQDKVIANNNMMANSAHQREMADLKAAGLNPILTGMGGSGAPVGSGAPMTSPVNTMQGLGDKIAGGMTSAAASKRARDQIDSTIGANDASNLLTGVQTELTKIQKEKTTHDARSAKAEADKEEMDAQIKKAQLPYELKWAPWKPAIDGVGKLTGTAAEAVGGGWLIKKLLGGSAAGGVPGMGMLKDGTKFDLNTGLIKK